MVLANACGSGRRWSDGPERPRWETSTAGVCWRNLILSPLGVMRRAVPASHGGEEGLHLVPRGLGQAVGLGLLSKGGDSILSR